MPIRRKRQSKTASSAHDDLSAFLKVVSSIDTTLANALVQRIVDLNSGKLVVDKIQSEYVLFDLFCSLSYAYYVKDDPLVSDSVFDAICKALVIRAKSTENPLIRKHAADFKSGSGYALDYEKLSAPKPENVYTLFKAVTRVNSLMEKLNGHSKETKVGKAASSVGKPVRKLVRIRRNR